MRSGVVRTRVVAAVAVLCCLAAAACGDGGSTADDPEKTAASASGSSTASETPTVADPEHAVDPPPPFNGAVVPPDILVYDPDAELSEDIVDRISKLKRVDEVARFSLAQVSIENNLVNLAAVDAETFRRFTPATTAQSQVVWDRIAGGELGMAANLRRRLPVDDDGYLTVGSSADAEAVHVGAYAPQGHTTIDLVVNEEWGDTLGMQSGNALLISTSQYAPQSIRKKLERIVGESASIQALDVVARKGLDINARQTAFLVGTVSDAVGTFYYKVLGGGRIAPDPDWERTHIATGEVPILGEVTCNKLLFPQLRAALREIVNQGLASEIHPDEYAGCYYPRFIAGTTKLSNHSFGLALDLNVPGNQRGTAGQIDRQVVAIFKKWGFAWGGDWSYTDPMHFEMNRLVKPG